MVNGLNLLQEKKSLKFSTVIDIIKRKYSQMIVKSLLS